MCSKEVLVTSVAWGVVGWLLFAAPSVPLIVSCVSGGLPVGVSVLGLGAPPVLLAVCVRPVSENVGMEVVVLL